MYNGGASPMSESVVTTSVSSATSQQAGAGGDRTQPPAAVEGRAGGKANRRRSRASRKAPTTVLNTDTANFRAMVQQYTGGPAVPFQAVNYLCGVPGASATRRQYDDSEGPGAGNGRPGAGAALGYGLAAGSTTAQQLHHHHHHPAVVPAALDVQQQYYQQYAQYNLQQHHERPLFMPAGGTVDLGGGGGDDGYFPRFGSSNLQRDHMADHASDGFLLERISSQMMPRPAASAGDTAAGDGFFL